ncbi:phage tail assembly chaperone [Pseudomonas nitroreducens]|uniref:phage tail assembly chaperone n=1 Tax=Pseudomonas nitroreducens TaxID=46680 RepID=UPI00265A39FC|nr:phage tail assembly chaperone [Pseudomonas nitroreducens]MCP1652742.1 hypothetical protein [Pseudomonas nitroreducens]
MAKKVATPNLLEALRATIADPWKNFRWESVTVPEWGGAQVRVRALTAADWLDYHALAQNLTPPPSPDPDAPPPAVPQGTVHQLYVFVMVRSLFSEDGAERLLTDEQVPELVANYGPVYDRLAEKAFALSQVQAASDPVEDAGNG